MAWKITTINKKCVEDVNYWSKLLEDGTEIRIRQSHGYRWGWAVVDEYPENHDYTEGALNVSELDIIDHSFEDGCWTDTMVENDEELPEEEEDLLSEAGPWLEDAGYDYNDSEVFFHGPLEIEEVEW